MKQKLKKIFNGASDIISKFFDGDFRGLAAEISFYLLSSFFPMFILIFTAVSSISFNYTDVMFRVISALPHQISDLLCAFPWIRRIPKPDGQIVKHGANGLKTLKITS